MDPLLEPPDAEDEDDEVVESSEEAMTSRHMPTIDPRRFRTFEESFLFPGRAPGMRPRDRFYVQTGRLSPSFNARRTWRRR